MSLRGNEVKSRTRALALMVGVLTLASVAAAQDGYKVVVHPGSSVSSLRKIAVSRIFLKKTMRWPDGTRAHPVDLDRTSHTRRVFSQDVHGKHPDAVAAYWQTLVFSGRDVPPPVRRSDEEVLSFVRTQPGAVGYVSAGSSAEGVAVLALE